MTAPELVHLITCPQWCTAPDAHALDEVDRAGTVYVWHHSSPVMAGGREISLQQCATLDPDGTRSSSPVELVVDGAVDQAHTVESARAFIAGFAALTLLAGGDR